jgi:hypothetical protein
MITAWMLALVLSIAGLLAVGIAGYSVRLAYRIAREANNGGHPILAYPVQVFLLLLLTETFLRRWEPEQIVIGRVVGVLAFAVPALNVWLIFKCERAGERSRDLKR